jgi:xylulokinase
MADLLLGIDIGTSAVKGLISDTTGRVVAQAAREHDLLSPVPGWAEELPAVWWQNSVAVMQDLLAQPGVVPECVAAVGTTGMLPAIVLLGKEGKVLRPSIQQNDARATAEIADLRRRIPADAFFQMTGASISQQSVGPKLMWLQKHEQDTWARTHWILGSYDYINYRLTGELGVEANWALESGLYELHTRAWSEPLLGLVGASRDQMPEIRAPTDVVGGITDEVAGQTGLLPGTPVVAGTADHVGAAFAAGIKAEGDLLIKFGSAGDILYCTERLIVDPRLYLDYHDIPGKYLLNGCMATSGSMVKWLVAQFFQADAEAAESRGQSAYQYLDRLADGVPAGSDGLIVLPYFLGEKTPVLDPQARGVFFGLTLFHNRAHLYRAALEGVVFGFKHHVQVLKDRGEAPRRVVAGEGGARSPLWRQIAADALGLPVSYLAHDPGASLAAAFVAGMGVGAFASWDEIERFVTIEDTVVPYEGNTQVYERQFDIYLKIYQHLKDDFRQIGTVSAPTAA